MTSPPHGLLEQAGWGVCDVTHRQQFPLRVAALKNSGPKETISAETIFPQTRILPYPVQPRNGLKGALPAIGPDARIHENSYKNRKPKTNKKKKKRQIPKHRIPAHSFTKLLRRENKNAVEGHS